MFHAVEELSLVGVAIAVNAPRETLDLPSLVVDEERFAVHSLIHRANSLDFLPDTVGPLGLGGSYRVIHLLFGSNVSSTHVRNGQGVNADERQPPPTGHLHLRSLNATLVSEDALLDYEEEAPCPLRLHDVLIESEQPSRFSLVTIHLLELFRRFHYVTTSKTWQPFKGSRAKDVVTHTHCG